MKRYLIIFTYIAAILFCSAIVIATGVFLMLSPPHIPSPNEIKFRWKLVEPIDSPSHLKQLTGFAWERVCIKDDFDWLERPTKRNYILIFYHKSKPVEEFYVGRNEHNNLELHVGHCFLSEQNFFHKIEDYNG
jgi:hypothetical protein